MLSSLIVNLIFCFSSAGILSKRFGSTRTSKLIYAHKLIDVFFYCSPAVFNELVSIVLSDQLLDDGVIIITH
jgi:hypothetical protein